MKKLSVLALVLVLAEAGWAKPFDLGISIGPSLVLPVSSSKIFDAPYGGFRFKWRFVRYLAVGFDFVYAGRKYFFYNQVSASWYGPQGWDPAAAYGVGQPDWIFYQDKALLDLLLYLQLPLDRVELCLGAGPAIAPISVSSASEYYPDFASASQSGQEVFKGFLVKAGADLHLFDFVGVNADFMFEVDDPSAFFQSLIAGGLGYFLSCSNFMFGLNLTL
jgi:hypothetical protein